MPRRNRRITIDTSLAELELIRVEHKEQVRQATREDSWDERRRRNQRREDARVRAVPHCVWPGCERRLVPLDRDVRPIPLCLLHACDTQDRLKHDSKLLEQASAYSSRRSAERGETWTTESRKQRRDAELRANEPGWIYYLRIDDAIKIGFTVDIRRRLKEYPPNAYLLAVHGGTKTLEKELHYQFRGCLTARREWFHPSDDLTAHVAQVVAKHGEPLRFRAGYREAANVTYPRRWSGGKRSA